MFIDERSDTSFDPRPDPFDIDDQTEYIKALRTDFVLQRGPYTVGLRGYFGHEEEVGDDDDDFDDGSTRDVYSIDAIWSRQLGRWLAFDLLGGSSAPNSRVDDVDHAREVPSGEGAGMLEGRGDAVAQPGAKPSIGHEAQQFPRAADAISDHAAIRARFS